MKLKKLIWRPIDGTDFMIGNNGKIKINGQVVSMEPEGLEPDWSAYYSESDMEMVEDDESSTVTVGQSIPLHEFFKK